MDLTRYVAVQYTTVISAVVMFRAFHLYILVNLYSQVTQVQHANRGVGT